jgi:hypothetical protein
MIITAITLSITIYTATVIVLERKEAKELAPTNTVDLELKAIYTKYTAV